MDWATHPFYYSVDKLCNPQQTISKKILTIFVAIVYLCICAAHITAGWYDWLAPSLPSSSQVGLLGPPTLWLINWDCEDSLESRASHAATRAMAEKEILLRFLPWMPCDVHLSGVELLNESMKWHVQQSSSKIWSRSFSFASQSEILQKCVRVGDSSESNPPHPWAPWCRHGCHDGNQHSATRSWGYLITKCMLFKQHSGSDGGSLPGGWAPCRPSAAGWGRQEAGGGQGYAGHEG